MEIQNLIKLFKGTQSEMAKRLGTTPPRISEYKKGNKSIPVSKLRKWCEILDIDIKDVI